MLPNVKNNIVYISILLILSCAYPLNIFGYSLDLNSPRIGDELQVLHLQRVFETSPGLLSLSDADIVETSKLRVYEPAKEDTISTMMIVKDKRAISVVNANDNLYIKNISQPGEKRLFCLNNPYVIPNDCSEVYIISDGTLSNIGEFVTHGKRHFEIESGLRLVTLDRDTLYNVECIKSSIEELFVYENTDSILHKGTLKQWYARGYRYPVLEHSADYMITMEGDTIDCVNRWLCIDNKHQEEKIREDVVNEMLRHVLDESYNFPKFGKNNHDSENKPAKNVDIEWNAETETVTVLHSFSNYDSPEDYILCDASGRVYSYGILNPSEQFSISLRAYSPGIYVFVTKNQNDFNSLKFTKL